MVEGTVWTRVCRSAARFSPALSSFAWRFRRFGTGWRRMDAHGRGHDRTDPLDRPTQSIMSLARLAAEVVPLTSRPGRRRGGVSVSRVTCRGGQGARASTRSGSDPQFDQPFELADFLTVQRNGGWSRLRLRFTAEVGGGAGSGSTTLGRRTCLRAPSSAAASQAATISGFEFGQPRPAVDDLRHQYLAVEHMR